MYRTGHYGAALLVFAPVALLLVASGFDRLAVLGGTVVVGGSMLPDVDQRIPVLSHRGATHTVWFALLVGVLVGGAAWVLGHGVPPRTRIGLAVFGFVVGCSTIVAHIFADALTPMGVRPFTPFGTASWSLGVTRAASPVGNALLLATGVLVATGAFVLGHRINPLL